MRPVRLFTAFVAAAVGSLVAAEQSQYAPLTAASLPKREIAACERTYGTGSIECGHANETEPMMCYNPSSGQVILSLLFSSPSVFPLSSLLPNTSSPAAQITATVTVANTALPSPATAACM